ncbi:MAG: methyltransferase domain-containing protein [Armatimonadetes bacterium]|nr:methyltransferase domain-containing protein [Akkermansiaceae bacterium]
MFPPRPTHLLHLLLKQKISPGDLVIDATAGNGHDTVFLAETVGPTGRVIAIDIQQQAIDSTRLRLQQENLLDRTSLFQISHTQIARLAQPHTASAILFNLGYLPGTDHRIITSTGDTLIALRAASEILQPGGILAVVCYPGHEGGDVEADATLGFFENLSNHHTARYGMIGTRTPSPFLLFSMKLSVGK